MAEQSHVRMISPVDPRQEVSPCARSPTRASATHPENDGYRIVVDAPNAEGKLRFPSAGLPSLFARLAGSRCASRRAKPGSGGDRIALTRCPGHHGSPPEAGFAGREAKGGHAGGDPGREGLGMETCGFPPN
jgi:hypothetical protein